MQHKNPRGNRNVGRVWLSSSSWQPGTERCSLYCTLKHTRFSIWQHSASCLWAIQHTERHRCLTSPNGTDFPGLPPKYRRPSRTSRRRRTPAVNACRLNCRFYLNVVAESTAQPAIPTAGNSLVSEDSNGLTHWHHSAIVCVCVFVCVCVCVCDAGMVKFLQWREICNKLVHAHIL